MARSIDVALFPETQEAPPETARITRLVIKSYQGIESLELDPGHVTVASGRKGAGKTSILDAITHALTGKGSRPRPVHDGDDLALVLIELSDGTQIKRTVTAEGKQTLTVGDARSTYKGPQEVLRQLFGTVDVFKPVEFLALPPAQQAQQLLRLVPLEIPRERYVELGADRGYELDFEAHPLRVLKQLEEALYDDRRVVNAEVRQDRAAAVAQRDGIPEGFDADGVRFTSLREMAESLQQCRGQNARRAEVVASIARVIDRRADLQAQIERIYAQIAELDANHEAEQAWLDENPEIDVAGIEAAVSSFEEQKAMLTKLDHAAELEKHAEHQDGLAEELTAKIDAVRALPMALLAEADAPVDGLGIDDAGNVTIHGLPLENLSDGERIELALEVARARAGVVPIVIVDGIERLDPETQAEFWRQAAADRAQYFVSLVADGDLSITSE